MGFPVLAAIVPYVSYQVLSLTTGEYPHIKYVTITNSKVMIFTHDYCCLTHQPCYQYTRLSYHRRNIWGDKGVIIGIISSNE